MSICRELWHLSKNRFYSLILQDKGHGASVCTIHHTLISCRGYGCRQAPTLGINLAAGLLFDTVSLTILADASALSTSQSH
jgi:hypothetical protein